MQHMRSVGLHYAVYNKDTVCFDPRTAACERIGFIRPSLRLLPRLTAAERRFISAVQVVNWWPL